MKTSVTYTGYVRKGTIPDWAKVQDALSRLEGKLVEVVVRLVRKQRSSPQNRYYFGVVVPAVKQMFEDAGNEVTTDDIHYFLKAEIGRFISTKFLKQRDGTPKLITVVNTSTKLTTEEWELWMLKIRKWAAEFGTQILEPNEHLQPPAH